jgi:AraC-like DNA-binding protein
MASRRDEIVARFLCCVQENYREHRDLGFYADLLGLSLKYMSHVIFEQTGRHPSQWIKDYVILDAKTMLRSGRYTVQQVAEELNFPNQSFFGKYFKEAIGMSPKKWMK